MRKSLVALVLAFAAILGIAAPATAAPLEVTSVTTSASSSDVVCATGWLTIGYRHTGTCTNNTDVNCPAGQHPIVKVYFAEMNGSQATKDVATAWMDDNDNAPRSATNGNNKGLASTWANVVNRGGGAGDLGDTLTWGQGSGWLTVTVSGQFKILTRNSCTL